MRLAELSERSGVSTATIKYYLREGLLTPGRRVSATQAEYDDEHLRRLRLVRALILVGRVPVARAREVLAAVDDESTGLTGRLGAAFSALPRGGHEAGQDDPATVDAAREVEQLLERLGWRGAREIDNRSPEHHSLVASVATLIRLGYACDADLLLPYAEQAERLAALDFEALEGYPTAVEKIEAAVVYTVLLEPVLLSLKRIAQENESARRYGVG
ncbi:MerR family transcriptional regulator [Streptomyces sp. TP-A0874]|uniref:MerR family transcriptional regulator n=1 Tax=Streptomyces sp. TP-A0874 TaxID=549819 RepID=UPI000852AE7B|nr:MerR family transcriptional regulator [Streptomyces sp. TP-A0874]